MWAELGVWRRAGAVLACAAVAAGTSVATAAATANAATRGAVPHLAGPPTPTWSQATPAHSPSARTGAAMAFDPLTGETILFGGLDAGTGAALGDTLTWNGVDWTPPAPTTAPSARSGAAMAFDAATGQFLLFGGTSGACNCPVGDTWTWNGTKWLHWTPAHSPPARADAATAFDAATGQLILFGGNDSGGARSDTWTWTGLDWAQLSPAHAPAARSEASMAFDPASGQLVLFGGAPTLGDTWTWTGSDWSQLSPAHTPGPRAAAVMAFDPSVGRLVLSGGAGASGTPTWEWNGSDWTAVSSAPPGRSGAAMDDDLATGRLVLFGGSDTDSPSLLDATWVRAAPYVAPAWTNADPVNHPSPLMSASSVFDPSTGQFLMFGGSDGSGGYHNETWQWSGSDWIPLAPAHSPSARVDASMVFDDATGQLLLFGGSANGVFLSDTWTWTGADWVELTPANHPSVRNHSAIAYDPATARVVLFGGATTGANLLNDTWAWSGTNWVNITPALQVPALISPHLAFDPANGTLLLVGTNFPSTVIQTWNWSGGSWVTVPSAHAPTARSGVSLAFDPVLGAVVLFGGISNAGYEAETWTWTGTDWTQLAIAQSPAARQEAASAFDPATGNVVVFGGWNGTTMLGDTWTGPLGRDAVPTLKTAWGSVKNPAALGGSFVHEKWAGATYKYTFTGTTLTWFTVTGPDQGNARVKITNPGGATVTRTVTNNAATTTIDTPVSFPGLTNAKHTISITVLQASSGSDTWVAVDGFGLDGAVTVPTPRAKTTFATLPNGLSGPYAYTSAAGATFTTTFRGTVVTWFALVGPDAGKARVSIDGAAQGTTDLYAPGYAWKTFSFPASDGLHSLKISVLGTKNAASTDAIVGVDRIQAG